MATMNVNVSTGNNNGYAFWSNRTSSNSTVFNPGTVFPFVGPHHDNAYVYTAWFYFRLQSLPQGSTINTAKLNLGTNNAYSAAGTNAGTNHIYIAVENNLDPTNTGRVINGTLGSQPWQRLGKQSAATTLLGNRCGPTHTKAGQTLATYAAGVREPEALIYHAYGDNRGLAAGSVTLTDSFGPALQALVNDPSWNSTDQWVMVHLFSDMTPAEGSNGGVGYFGGITWNNGQVAVANYGNGGGQLKFYNTNVIPQLQLDYTAGVSAVKSGFFQLMSA